MSHHHEDVSADFPYATLEGGAEKWAEKYVASASPYKDQFFWAARSFVGFVVEALGEHASSPTPEQLRAAFDAAAKQADGTSQWPFDELVGTFTLGSAARNFLFILGDVWVHGPAMRDWWIRRIARCPAEVLDLATRPSKQLVVGRWDGPVSENWPRFTLNEGVEWSDWQQLGGRMGMSPWAMSMATAFVAQLEANLATMSFVEAADKAHEQVVQIDYRPTGVTMTDYKNQLWTVSQCLYHLERFWPRFAELREWACASRFAEAYGTNILLKSRSR